MPTKSSPLAKSIKRAVDKKAAWEPLWKGPMEDGLTQSVISTILADKERARIALVEGWSTAEAFDNVMEYGNMWHVCEEHHAGHRDWNKPLMEYAKGLQKKYPTQQPAVVGCMRSCQAQFPVYIDYWKNHKDVKNRTPVYQELVFDIPYKLPSGRVVRLRGKWDSLDVFGSGRNAQLILQENKTKSDVGDEGIKRRLLFDLQTMMYLITVREHIKIIGLAEFKKRWGTVSIGGVLYNVIKRPLSGGIGSIRKKKPNKQYPKGQSDDEFYEELQQVFVDNAEVYFKRWKVDINETDIDVFERRFLQPCLEHICDWWEYLESVSFQPWKSDTYNGIHWQHPVGLYNPIDKGYQGDLDEYVATGKTTGLVKRDTIFPELQ